MTQLIPSIQLVRDWQNNKFKNGSVVTIGNYDGLHLGHQLIIKEVIKNADRLSLPSCLLTFEPLPQQYLQREKLFARITNFANKVKLLAKLGLNWVYCLRFKQIVNLTAEEFVEHWLVKCLNTKLLIVGEDFRFGKNKTGCIKLLKKLSDKYNFELQIIKDINFGNSNTRISSTKLRELIKQGSLSDFQQFTGRDFLVESRVIKGQGRGRLLGFKTANFNIAPKYVLPLGVYYTLAKIQGEPVKYHAVTNIGVRPTVCGKSKIRVMETHLLDFDQDIYGAKLEVTFKRKIREEQKFNNLEQLTNQIAKDIDQAKKLSNINEMV